MALTDKLPSWVKWALSFPLIILNGWVFLIVFHYFESLITVFITANLFAFILNYPVQLLTSRRIKRGYAVLGVFLIAFLVLGILGVTLAPIIVEQIVELAERLPSWLESGTQQLQTLNEWATARNFPVELSGVASQLAAKISELLQSFTGEILGFALGTVGNIVDSILIIVLTFYLLLQGSKVWNGVGEWLPQPAASQIQQLLRQNFNNYFIGQASLAAIIGSSMTLAFTILQVPFSLLFGLGVGVMALFPFGAISSIFVVSFLVALKSFWLGLRVLVVAVVIEQAVENGVAPKLLGGFIGLNPVWILVSLLIGAKVAGVLGVLIALPVAGCIKSTATLLRENNSSVPDKMTETEVSLVG
ncbi:MAG: AI-2E family transporter [Spirulinaceae cyanobacterium]